MKKYKYVAVVEMEKYIGWNVEGIFPAASDNMVDYVLISKEDKPIQNYIKLEEFEDIEPLVLRTFKRTGQAITTDRLEDYCDYNFEMIENTIAKIVLNQKKIIERLNDVKDKR